jgi:hypothetical protein
MALQLAQITEEQEKPSNYTLKNAERDRLVPAYIEHRTHINSVLIAGIRAIFDDLST